MLFTRRRRGSGSARSLITLKEDRAKFFEPFFSVKEAPRICNHPSITGKKTSSNSWETFISGKLPSKSCEVASVKRKEEARNADRGEPYSRDRRVRR